MLALFLASILLNTPSVRAVEVPLAPPPVTIVTDGDDRIRKRHSVQKPTAELTIRLPVDQRGDFIRPLNARKMVKVLHSALQDEYKFRLMCAFGFEHRKPCSQIRSRRYDLRLGDLYHFLAQVWSLNDSGTLAREVACMSTGEGSFLPVIALVVQRELQARPYRRRRDVPQDMHINAAMAVSERLLSLCDGSGGTGPR